MDDVTEWMAIDEMTAVGRAKVKGWWRKEATTTGCNDGPGNG